MIQVRNFFKRGAIGAFFISMVLLTGTALAAQPASPTTPTTTHTKKSTTHHHTTMHHTIRHSHTSSVHHPVTHHSRSHYHAAKYKHTTTLNTTALNTYQDSICSNAESELGKLYLWGGTSPRSGFDCSGFSQYVYKQEGIEIPRTALEQYETLTPVKHPQPGDLVFFRTHGRHVSHVGIYLGNGYFIHSPRTGEAIRVDKLSSLYWKERYAGARRALNWNYLSEHFKNSSFRPSDANAPEFDPVT